LREPDREVTGEAFGEDDVGLHLLSRAVHGIYVSRPSQNSLNLERVEQERCVTGKIGVVVVIILKETEGAVKSIDVHFLEH
jgi:hypothetical protein